MTFFHISNSFLAPAVYKFCGFSVTNCANCLTSVGQFLQRSFADTETEGPCIVSALKLPNRAS